MGKKESVRTINRVLAGSPYLLPEDEIGEVVAALVIKRMRNLENRVRKLNKSLEERHEDLRRQLLNDYVVRQVYESNALEGLGPNLKETYEIISNRGQRNVQQILKERTVGESFRVEPKLADVEGLHDAYTFAGELAQTTESFREVDLRNLHHLITKHERFAGEYKQVEVEIGGSTHVPTPVFDVERSVRELVEWINIETAPPSLSATVGHAWLTHIHPFQDGNGRTARILANLLLARSGYPPLVIKSTSDKGEYLEALAHSDEGGDILIFFDLVVKALHRAAYELETPEMARNLLQKDLFPGEDADYQSWVMLLGAVSAALSRDTATAGYKFDVVGGLGRSDFKLLQGRSKSGNGWYAKLQGLDVQLLLWFGYTTSEMLSRGYVDQPGPSIFFSERDRRPIVEHAYRPLTGTRVFPIDEVTFLPGRKLPVHVRDDRGVRRMRVEDLPEALLAAVDTYRERSARRSEFLSTGGSR